MNISSTTASTAPVPVTSVTAVPPLQPFIQQVTAAHSCARPAPFWPGRWHHCWRMTSAYSVESLAKLMARTQAWNTRLAEIQAGEPGSAQQVPVSSNDKVDDARIKCQQYRRNSAIKAGFIKPDGGIDITAYNRYLKRRSAIKAGFGKPDGSIDMVGFYRLLRQRLARRAGLLQADGSPDITALYRQQRQRGALNAGFKKADGKADFAAYYRYRRMVGVHHCLVAQRDGNLTEAKAVAR